MHYQKNSANENEIENQWLKIRYVFLDEYRVLKSSDLDYQKGDFEKMLNHLGRKIGLTESQLRRKILRWEEAAAHYF